MLYSKLFPLYGISIILKLNIMTLNEAVEKIKNLNGNKMFYEKELSSTDTRIVERAITNLYTIEHDINNLMQLTYDMVIYPENYPETQHPAIEDIID